MLNTIWCSLLLPQILTWNRPVWKFVDLNWNLTWFSSKWASTGIKGRARRPGGEVGGRAGGMVPGFHQGLGENAGGLFCGGSPIVMGGALVGGKHQERPCLSIFPRPHISPSCLFQPHRALVFLQLQSILSAQPYGQPVLTVLTSDLGLLLQVITASTVYVSNSVLSLDMSLNPHGDPIYRVLCLYFYRREEWKKKKAQKS